jgi:hypothetical protein
LLLAVLLPDTPASVLHLLTQRELLGSFRNYRARRNRWAKPRRSEDVELCLDDALDIVCSELSGVTRHWFGHGNATLSFPFAPCLILGGGHSFPHE